MWKRKITASLLCFSLLFTCGLAVAEEDGSTEQQEVNKQYQKMELTKKQQKQVAPYVKKAFESKREMIKKYMEVGALDKEKGEKWLKKIDEKEKMMKEQGYSLYCPKYKEKQKYRDEEEKNN